MNYFITIIATLLQITMRQETIKFLKDVEQLDFKFPVAEISELTGYGKSNVSEYLNGKKEPSKNFLKQFYKSLESSEKVTRETDLPDKDRLIQALLEQNQLLKYVIEMHAMLRVLTAKLVDKESLKSVERAVNQLLEYHLFVYV